MVLPIDAKFGMVAHFDRLEHSHPLNFPHFENRKCRRLPSGKIEKLPNLMNGSTDRREFGVVTHFCPC